MSASGELVFVGGYTGESGGEGEGIALLRRDPVSGTLTRLGVAVRTPSPSFLAQHPTLPVLYAVNELDAGTVSAFAVADDGGLTPLATRSTGGAHPCHLAVTVDGRHVLAANYSSGSVSVHPLDPDGAPGDRSDLLSLHGEGPDQDRQEGPHAHMVVPQANPAEVLVVDLGSDRVWRARLDPVSGRLTESRAAVATPAGTGPRHLAQAPGGGLLVAGELTGDLSWYAPSSDGALVRAGAVRASTVTGANQPSEILLSADGRFVYLANRGPDTVSVFEWNPEKDGASLVAEVPTGGVWPRHMVLASSHLYVTNERSHTVTVFRVDPDTGIPHPQGDPVGEGSPTCFLRSNPVAPGSPVS